MDKELGRLQSIESHRVGHNWSNLSCTQTWHCYRVVWCFCLNLWKSCQIFQSSWNVLHSYKQFVRLSVDSWPCQLLAILNFWCDFWYLIGFILHCPNDEHFFIDFLEIYKTSLWECVLLFLFMKPIVLLFTQFVLFTEPGWAWHKLRSWKEIQGAIGTADMFILSWLAQQP